MTEVRSWVSNSPYELTGSCCFPPAHQDSQESYLGSVLPGSPESGYEELSLSRTKLTYHKAAMPNLEEGSGF